MDRVSKQIRSKIMSSVSSKHTKPEKFVVKVFRSSGFRFSLHKKDLPGRPDLVLKEYKAAVFVHGCFWHGHDSCKYGRLPKSNKRFWTNKIVTNSQRDTLNVRALKKMGYRVYVIWECQIKRAISNDRREFPAIFNRLKGSKIC